MRLRFFELVKILEQVFFYHYIFIISGPNFTKLVWIVLLIILVYITGLNVDLTIIKKNRRGSFSCWRRLRF